MYMLARGKSDISCCIKFFAVVIALKNIVSVFAEQEEHNRARTRRKKVILPFPDKKVLS